LTAQAQLQQSLLEQVALPQELALLPQEWVVARATAQEEAARVAASEAEALVQLEPCAPVVQGLQLQLVTLRAVEAAGVPAHCRASLSVNMSDSAQEALLPDQD